MCLLQRGGRSFTNPIWPSRTYVTDLDGRGGDGLRAASWRRGLVTAVAYGLHPPLAVEEFLQVVVLLPLYGSNWYGVLLLLCLSGYRLWRWRFFLPAWLWCYHPLSPAVSSQSVRPHNVRHGETTMVTARLWWRMLVGDK
jgi:hypothetical protein